MKKLPQPVLRKDGTQIMVKANKLRNVFSPPQPMINVFRKKLK